MGGGGLFHREARRWRGRRKKGFPPLDIFSGYGVISGMNDYLAWILAGLGLALFLEGSPYFLFPTKMRSWLRLITTEATDRQMRNAGLLGILLGSALVCLATLIE